MPTHSMRATLLTLSLLSACPLLQADLVTWTNPLGGSWTDPSWSPHSPNGGDDIINPLTNAPIQLNTNIALNSFLSQSNFTVSAQFSGTQTASASAMQVNANLLIDGGGITDITINPGTAGSFQYSGNGNNFLSNTLINANLTPASGGFIELFNTSTLNATWTVADTTGGIRFHDGNAQLLISSSGTLHGFTDTFNFFTGGVLTNNGHVAADVANQTLTLGSSNIAGSGNFAAANGGTLLIAGLFTGSNATISVDPNPASTVLVNGGGISGSFASATGTGLSFSPNGNNFISNANIAGNVTLSTSAFAEIFNSNTISGNLTLSDANATLRFHDGNALLNIAGTMHGFGSTVDFFTGGTLLNTGLISADVANQSLTLNDSNIAGNGTFQGINGGALVIGGRFTGTNATVHADTGSVTINGGTVAGSFASSTGTGISFSPNGNNQIDGAAINGNLTLSGAGFTDVLNAASVSGTIAMSTTSNGLRLHDGNAVLTLTSTGLLRGFGQVFGLFTGGTLTNNGVISADISNQTLALDPTFITGNGTFQAIGNGTLAIGATLNASNATIHADTGTVLVDGGTLSGSYLAATGSGFSFSSNGNNAINTAVINGNATIAGAGFVDVFGVSSIAGTIAMSGTSNGLRLHDGNTDLTLTGTLHGFGTVFGLFAGGTLTNNGTISADIANQTLSIDPTSTNGTGTFQAANGGTLVIDTVLTAANATIHANAGKVLVDGGTISGSYIASTGTGFTFSPNGNNSLNNATINGNVTISGAGFADASGINIIAGTLAMSGASNGLRIRDGNADTIVTGTLRGFGTIFGLFSGGTLTNNGLISADVANQTLNLSPPNTNGTGTFQALNGGTLLLNTLLVATNATIHADTGTVLVDGGTVSGTYIASTGAGFTFSPNGNNSLNNATINGNLTISGAAFTDASGINTISGNISLASTSNGLRLHDGNSQFILTPSATLHGFGTVFELFGGSQFINHGTVSADTPAQSLTFSNSVVQSDGHLNILNNSTLINNAALTTTGSLLLDGTLINNNSLTQSGSITSTANAQFLNNNGLATFASNFSLSNLAIAGGRVGLNGKLVVNPTAAAKPATLTTLGSYIANNSLFENLPDPRFGFALIDNAITHFTTFGGLPVTNNSLLLAAELLGDSNLDGKVDLSDLNIVLNNLGQTASSWTSGNFDHASTIDLTDLNDVLNNLGLTYANPTTQLPITNYQLPFSPTPTPEPATLSVLALGALPLGRRRKR